MRDKQMIIIAIFFTILVIINSKILNFFGISEITGTYEFTKSIFFNIFLSLFTIYFTIKNFKEKIIIPKIFFLILGLFGFSIFFSVFPLTNVFGNNLKGHGIIFFCNLLILFIILINKQKDKVEELVRYITFLSPLVFILAILEYFFGTNFIDIGFRAYPSFLALYSLLLLPFILERISFKKFSNIDYKKNFINIFGKSIGKRSILKVFYISTLLLLTITLFLTKIIFAIAIYIIYLSYFLSKKIGKKLVFSITFLLSLVLLTIFLKDGIKEEMSLLISKLLVWESTYESIYRNVKSSLFGVGNDSLIYIFEAYKSKYLYIFENINFSVDRANNLFLDLFFSFGIVGLAILFNYLHNFYIGYKGYSIFYHMILIFLIYTFINHSSVINYIFFIIVLAYISIKNARKKDFFKTKIFLIIFSVLSIISSLSYFYEETKNFENKKYETKNIIFKNLKLENKEEYIIKTENDIFKICEKLLEINKSAENFFYCGNFFWEIGYDSLAKVYYEKGLEKIPDVWNQNSTYFNNIFIKYLFDKEKFFDEKHSNIKQILERITK